MPTSYRLDVYNTSGVLQYQLTDFLELAYTMTVNAPGMVGIQLDGEHDLLSNIADKWQFEVWRRPEGEAWARQITGIYRDLEWFYFEDRPQVNLYCPGLMSMLSRKVVNWYAGLADRSMFLAEKSETIMNTLVDYNAGVNATTGNGRERVGSITGLTVESDGAAGNTHSWWCHGKNLLTTLQELALIAGGDFDLVKTSSTAWEFRWYTGQLGTDRTATVTFSMAFGNMGEPQYFEGRSNEKTVAAVWGQGEGSLRDYVTRTGTNYTLDTNDIEVYVDAREIDLGDTTSLNSKGDQKLVEKEAVTEFAFEAIQTPATVFGVHYFLGDKITAINPFTGASITMKVNKVVCSFTKDGTETILPEFTTVL